jgi:hypothetical protein
MATTGDADSGDPFEKYLTPRPLRPKLPPLHWLRGWGKRIESWLEGEHWDASECDWMIMRADRDAADAMLEFSVGFPTLIEEIRRCQIAVEEAGAAALADPNDATLYHYADSQDVLASRIAKVCDIIEKNTRPAEELEFLSAGTDRELGRRILEIIDAHSHVDSQTDLLDKMAAKGWIEAAGTVSGILSKMKTAKTLVAWNGNRGYCRPGTLANSLSDSKRPRGR